MVGLMTWASVAQDQLFWRKGPWTPEEDKLLFDYVTLHGEGRWSSVARSAGLNRSGKSCRLRWVNYLRPGLKRGQITPQEEGIIIELHALWGNKWSTIARYLPGRTDNEIKNYWRTHFKKKERSARKASQRRKSKQAKAASISPSQPQLLQKQQSEATKPEANIIPMTMGLPVSSTTGTGPINYPPQGDHKQEPIFMNPNPAMGDHNLITPASSWTDAMCLDQDGPWWGSLWNFCDQNSAGGKSIADQIMQEQQDQYCGKVALSVQQNQGATNYSNNNNIIINVNTNHGFSWAGDPNNLYNIEGYIF